MTADADPPRHAPPRGLILLAAVARDGAIGRHNRLLVHLPGDLPRFKALTLGHPVVMGRKTFESIGKPLPGRFNIVMTRNPRPSFAGAETAHDLPRALALARQAAPDAPVFVIGGAEIFEQALPFAQCLLLTEIDAEYPDADAFFPAWPRALFTRMASEPHATPQGLAYHYTTYERTTGD